MSYDRGESFARSYLRSAIKWESGLGAAARDAEDALYRRAVCLPTPRLPQESADPRLWEYVGESLSGFCKNGHPRDVYSDHNAAGKLICRACRRDRNRALRVARRAAAHNGNGAHG